MMRRETHNHLTPTIATQHPDNDAERNRRRRYVRGLFGSPEKSCVHLRKHCAFIHLIRWRRSLNFGAVKVHAAHFGARDIVALPNAYTADSGSVVGAANLLFNDENILKARVLYGVNEHVELGASLSVGVVDGITASAANIVSQTPRPCSIWRAADRSPSPIMMRPRWITRSPPAASTHCPGTVRLYNRECACAC